MISVSRVAFFPTGSSEAAALILSAWTVIVVSWLVSLPPGVHLPSMAMYILGCHYSDPSDMKIQWKSFKGKLFNLAYMVTNNLAPASLPCVLLSFPPSCNSALNQTVVILYAFVCVLCLSAWNAVPRSFTWETPTHSVRLIPNFTFITPFQFPLPFPSVPAALLIYY